MTPKPSSLPYFRPNSTEALLSPLPPLFQAQQHRGTSDSEEELSLGLRTYFDKSLQVVLLYRGEREQAVQVRAGVAPHSL